MRHAGVQYLIIRDVNFLNHRGENDWIARIRKGPFAACVYARLHFPSFRPEALSAHRVARLTRLADFDHADFMQGMWLVTRHSFRSRFRSQDMICIYDVMARTPHVSLHI